MKKLGKQLLSILLVLVLILQIIPASTFAEEESVESTTDDEVLVESRDDNYAEALRNQNVLYEETSLREETVKHFRMEDGSFIAVDYQMPVHYLDENNEWTDYDNTLVAVENEEKAIAYRVENGDSVRTFAATDVGETLLSLEKGEYALTFSPETENKRSNDEEELPAETKDVKILQVSAGSAEEITEPLLAKTQPDKLYSALEYTDILDGVSLRYENYANTVKENIVISAPQSDYSYTFRLTLKGLAPKTEEDGSIVLCSEEGNVIYTIPAPYMIDNNHEESYEAQYVLTEDGDAWLLTVTADSEWMNAADRAYPVLLDPTVVETGLTDYTLSGGFVRSGYPTSPDPGDTGLYVGDNGNNNGDTRSYFHVNQLVDLPEGCELYYAGFAICQYTHEYKSGGSDLQVGLYGIDAINNVNAYGFTAANWRTYIASLTWNMVQDSQFVHNSYMTDTKTLGSSTSGSYITWDVTTLAYDWYEGKNLGFALIPTNEATASSRAAFYGPKKTDHLPALILGYRNTVGLESYYTYQTLPIGRAGTSYISDYTMQNTLVVPLLDSPSNVMPFSLSLVYNSAYGSKAFTSSSEAIHTKNYSNMILGAGWKLSAQQTVVSTTVSGTTYRIYTDADGTEHYFSYNSSSGKYEDEDGLGLSMTGSGSYTMSDQSGNSWYFASGYLTRITDAYGNKVNINYNASNQITSITRVNTGGSTETLATLSYTSNKLTTITSEGTAKTITLGYGTAQSTTCLTSITFPGSKVVNYTYFNTTAAAEKARLKTAYDADAKYGIEYSYSYNKDVRNFYEYVQSGSTKTYGVKQHGFKRSHAQAVYRYYGEDGNAETSDDILSVYILDTYGRTISKYALDNTEQHVLGAAAAQYSANSGTSKKNNRLTSNIATGQTGVNLLENSNVENGADDWTNASIATTKHRHGSKSLYLNNTVSTATYQGVTLEASKEYTFSAYFYAESPNSNAHICFQNASGSSTYAPSEKVNFATTGIGDGWVRIETTYKPSSSGAYRVAVIGSGAYADCLQLEQEDAASSYNLIEDGSFEGGYGCWVPTGTSNNVTCSTFFGTRAAHVSGSAGKHHIEQTVMLSLPSETTFFFSAWAKANADPNSVAAKTSDNDIYFGMYARIYYQGVSTPETQFFPFDAYYSDWQYMEAALIPKEANKTITKITVACAYDSNINDAYFDNVALRVEPAQTYRYDDNGNAIAVTQTGAGSQSAIYSGIDLTQYTAANGVKTTYTYNGKHDVATASLGGVTCTNTYDTSGNVTQSKLTGSGTSYYLQSSSTVTTDRNHVASSTDANGNTVSYTYNPNTEQLSSTTQNGVTVNYTYNADGTPHSTYQSGVAALTYAYSGGQLTQIDRKSFLGSAEQHQYLNMTYNRWGQTKSITISGAANSSGMELVSYSYNGFGDEQTAQYEGGTLSRTTYGNGQYATYSYDEFDRLEQVRYNNNGRFIRYYYNADGALSKLIYGDGTTTKGSYQFEYDSLGRLIRSAEYNGSGTLVQRTEHNYDEYNRLSAQRWMLGSTTYSESYSYSDGENGDGSLTSMSAATGDTVDYDYDNLKRLHQRDVYIAGSTTPLSTVYGYRTVSGNRSSAQVEYYNVVRGSNYSVKNKYTYDARGNITAVYEDVTGTYRLVSQYTYDAQNQLTKEIIYNYGSSGNSTDTYEYAYDTAGNIQTVKKNGTTTQSYSYSNDNWKDQLSSITSNGSSYSILYDNSGNPTTYRRGTNATYYLTWSNGRQLTKTVNGGTTTNYTYDADGIRTWKKVGSVNHYYVTQNGKVVRETIGSGSNARILDFIYDESGRPFALIDSEGANDPDPDTYYYILNLQGDVVKLVDETDAEAAVYAYDAWGNILPNSTSGPMADINPLRYRGYYYDTETGWYYLQSRYYDPVIHRFINADSYASTNVKNVLSCNMYAYCENNPSNAADPSGRFLFTLIGAVVGAAVGAIDAAINGEDILTGALSGAASGAITGAAADVLLVTGGSGIAVVGVMALAGGLGEVASTAVKSARETDPSNKATFDDYLISFLGGAAVGAIFGCVSGPLPSKLGGIMKDGFATVAKRIIGTEVQHLGRSIVEETLSATTASLMKLGAKVFAQMAEKAFVQ